MFGFANRNRVEMLFERRLNVSGLRAPPDRLVIFDAEGNGEKPKHLKAVHTGKLFHGLAINEESALGRAVRLVLPGHVLHDCRRQPGIGESFRLEDRMTVTK